MKKRKTHKKPKMPDGRNYEFNCCSEPNVWEYKNGRKLCETCGYDWTNELKG